MIQITKQKTNKNHEKHYKHNQINNDTGYHYPRLSLFYQ